MKNTKLKKEILSWIYTIIPAIAIGLFLSNKVVANANVPTGSMESTIMAGDRVLGNRLAYTFSAPSRGDVIMFAMPDDESQNYLKRIIGLPGEKLEIIDGCVYIDDSDMPLEEPYLNEDPVGSFGPFYIPEDSYFVMGDNRNNSYDSRLWNHPYVTSDQIMAKVMVDYFPSIHTVNYEFPE